MVALAMAGSLAEADLHAAKVYPVDVSKILEDVH
jgi:hypothetical protein